MSFTTTISVVIPTYNRSHLVRVAIESVLAQTRQADEIIIVDDGSSDRTAEVVSMYAGVRLVKKENGGLASARNAGIEAAQSEWITFLDDDDWFAPRMLEEQQNALARQPDADVVYTASYRVDGEGKIIGRNHRGHHLPAIPLAALATENFILCSSVRVRRATLLAAKMFDSTVRLCEDQDLWLRVAALGARFIYVEQPLAYITKQPGTMSSSSLRMAQATLDVLVRRRPILQSLLQADGREWWLAGAHYRLGRVHWEAGDLSAAANEFQKAREYDPHHRGARLYGWVAAHPQMERVFRMVRRFKRGTVRILQQAGIAESRWG